MFALRERRVHVTQARTRPLLEPVRNTGPSMPAELAARAMKGRQTPHVHAHFELPAYCGAMIAARVSMNCNCLRRTLRVRLQEDFEMAVAKVMKKDSEKNVSLKKLWK